MKTQKDNLNKTNLSYRLWQTKWKIEHEFPLHHHSIFWLPIVFFSILALWSGLTALDFSTSFPSSTEHIESVLTGLKLPVFYLSLAVPISVAIGRFHGSSQRAEANRIALANQSFEHHFKHTQYFIEHMDFGEYKDTLGGFFKLKYPRKLYSLIYPNSSMVHFDITTNEATDNGIFEALKEIPGHIQQYNKMSRNSVETRLNYLSNSFGLVLDIDEFMHNGSSLQGQTSHDIVDSLLSSINRTLAHALSFNRSSDSYQKRLDDAFLEVVDTVTSQPTKYHAQIFTLATKDLLASLALNAEFTEYHYSIKRAKDISTQQYKYSIQKT
jgi:hypothetical protein